MDLHSAAGRSIMNSLICWTMRKDVEKYKVRYVGTIHGRKKGIPQPNYLKAVSFPFSRLQNPGDIWWQVGGTVGEEEIGGGRLGGGGGSCESSAGDVRK